MDGQRLGISRRAANGDAGAGGGQRGKQDELAEVFPADAADGGEEDGGRGVCGRVARRRGGEGNRVGEQDGVFRRQAGGGEKVEIAGVEEGVADAGRERIERPAVRHKLVVRGTTLLGEVVDLKDDALVFPNEAGDDMGDEAVLPERVVVEMPEVGRAAERFGGGGAEGLSQVFGGVVVRRREVVEAGDGVECGMQGARRSRHGLGRDAPATWRRVAGEDDVPDAGGGEGLRGGFDHSRHAAGSEVIVDDGDVHGAAFQSPTGLAKWKPQISKPRR